MMKFSEVAESKLKSRAPNLWDNIVTAVIPAFGNQGDTLRDLTGNRNVGTLTNMSPATDYVFGKYGRALQFTGGTERVTFGTSWVNDVFDNANAITLVLGVKFRSLSTNQNYNCLIDFFVQGNSQLVWTTNTTKILQIGGRSQTSDSFQSVTGSTDLSAFLNQWINITGIWDYQNARVIGYINGIEELNSSVTWGSTTFNGDGSPSYADSISGSGVNLRRSTTDLSYFYAYKRKLTTREIHQIISDPFIWLKKKKIVVSTVEASGALIGSLTISVSNSGVMSGAGALVGSSSVNVSNSGVMAGSGALVGSSDVNVSNSGVPTGSGALIGSLAISISNSGVMIASGALIGSSSISVSNTGVMVGDGALVGSLDVNISNSGVMIGSGALIGSSDVNISNSGVMAGSGSLIGNSDIEISCDGILSGGDALVGNTSVSVSVSGVMSGAGALIGNSSISISNSGVIIGDGTLVGSSSVNVSNSGVMTASGALVGSSNISISNSGVMNGDGALIGSSSFSVSCDGVLTGGNELIGNTSITFACSGVMTGSGALVGSSSISVSCDGVLAGGDELIGNASVTFTCSGVPTGSGSLVGSSTFSITCDGVLTDESSIVGACTFSISCNGVLRGEPIILLIEQEIETLLSGLTVSGGYRLNWATVNYEDRALEDNTNYDCWACVYLKNIENHDDVNMVHGSAYSNKALYTIESRVQLTSESTIPKFDARKRLYLAEEDIKRVFGNYPSLNSVYASNVQYVGSQLIEDTIGRGDRFCPIMLETSIDVWYFQDRTNPDVVVQ